MYQYVRCLLFAGLLAASFGARGQGLITDASRALAARDTLFRQAQQLRELAQQKSVFFLTTARARYKRREVVRGTEKQPTGPLGAIFTWQQTTRYRRNGRVQQWFSASVGNTTLVEEYRLDGRTLWLSFPRAITGSNGQLPRHIGRYYASGFVSLDKEQYVLPSPMH